MCVSVRERQGERERETARESETARERERETCIFFTSHAPPANYIYMRVNVMCIEHSLSA